MVMGSELMPPPLLSLLRDRTKTSTIKVEDGVWERIKQAKKFCKVRQVFIIFLLLKKCTNNLLADNTSNTTIANNNINNNRLQWLK